MSLDPPGSRRRSIRQPGFDYSHPGVYFVTCCAFRREEIFGAVVEAEMQPSPLGRLIRAEWFRSIGVRREVELFRSEFVLMPNHLHGIVWTVADEPAGSDEKMSPSHAPRSLASFIAAFKAAVARRAGQEMGLTDIWQRDHYEHLIRNETELQTIRVYIHANPQRWLEDQLHPSAPPNRFNRDQ